MSVLSVDIETAGDELCRLGMGDGTQTLSCQWSPEARELLQHELLKAEVVVGQNIIGFDIPRLRAHGVDFNSVKAADTMIAHRLLFPFQRAALGHGAPLLVPLEPFKHEASDKPAWYNQCDTHFTLLWWLAQSRLLASLDMERLFWDVEMPSAIALQAASERGIHVEDADGRALVVHPGWRPKAVKGGPYSSITGEVEARSPRLGFSATRPSRKGSDPTHAVASGRGYRSLTFPEAVFELAAYWGDCAAEPPADPIERVIARRTCEGAGPVTIRRELGGDASGVKPRDVREVQAEWIASHRGLVAWHKRIKATAAKEGYIINPFGRRGYGVRDKMALEFMFRSTVSDALKVLAAKSSGLVGLVEGALVLDGSAVGTFEQGDLPVPLTAKVEAI